MCDHERVHSGMLDDMRNDDRSPMGKSNTSASEPDRVAVGEPTRDDLEAVALGALQRMQDAARSHGILRGRPRPSRARRAAIAQESELESGAVGEDARDDEVALADSLPRGARAVLGSVAASTRGAGTRWVRAPGLAAQRTRWREPAGLGSIIERASHRLGWDGPAAMGSVLAKWHVIVGDDLAEHCHVETFEGRKLQVRCTSTAWAKQLQLLLPHIERRIEEEVGPGVVDQVVVCGPTAPSWRRGRFSVPGRGPRDTYG